MSLCMPWYLSIVLKMLECSFLWLHVVTTLTTKCPVCCMKDTVYALIFVRFSAHIFADHEQPSAKVLFV